MRRADERDRRARSSSTATPPRRWAPCSPASPWSTWYPITPSSSVVENLIDYMKKYRIEPDGKATFAIVQAEDELAAIGMVLGAGWAGARSMTATSGPGISLMAEFAGLGYYAEIPGVIFDVQRTGPSTGLPTRTSQGDLTFIAGSVARRHQTRHAASRHREGVLRVRACEAFDLAEQLQTPVFVLSDLDLGMNNWMSEPFEYPEKPHRPRQGARRRRTARSWAASRATRMWTATAFRTARCPAPTIRSAAYFTRGCGHNEKALYTERPDDYENNMERLARKFETAKTLVPEADRRRHGQARRSASSPSAPATGRCIESRDQLAARIASSTTDYLRMRAYPFTQEVHDFVAAHERVYVVEQNRDAQMLSLLKLDLRRRRRS